MPAAALPRLPILASCGVLNRVTLSRFKADSHRRRLPEHSATLAVERIRRQ